MNPNSLLKRGGFSYFRRGPVTVDAPETALRHLEPFLID